ncbi:hypothetical protein [Massilia sp. TSP1-1-2]|uniref:hypothetical protein n=1 Tax=Massilia sp. TSP1-1-2 TaxID=2804649 RepID=UPI003CED0A13
MHKRDGPCCLASYQVMDAVPGVPGYASAYRMNIRKILRALAGGLYLLLGLLFVFSGLQNAHKLWSVATPNLHFLKTTGSVEEVVKHGNPDSEAIHPS